MGIKGYNFPALLVLEELHIQIELARHVHRKLVSGSQGWQDAAAHKEFESRGSPLELISRCSSFLSSTALVAKFLFPGSSAPPSLKARRCSALRTLLQSEDINTIRKLSVRNSFEHLDERLDERLPGLHTGTWESIRIREAPPDAGTLTVKWLHPRTLTLSFLDDSIDLSACIQELALIDGRIELAMRELATRRVELWTA
jgi:hypothetical protein